MRLKVFSVVLHGVPQCYRNNFIINIQYFICSPYSIISPEPSTISWIACHSVVSSAANRVDARSEISFYKVFVVVHVRNVNNFQIIRGAGCWERLRLVDWLTGTNTECKRKWWIESSTLPLQCQSAHLMRSQTRSWVDDINHCVHVDVHESSALLFRKWCYKHAHPEGRVSNFFGRRTVSAVS